LFSGAGQGRYVQFRPTIERWKSMSAEPWFVKMAAERISFLRLLCRMTYERIDVATVRMNECKAS
jgi:hypothetical protein